MQINNDAVLFWTSYNSLLSGQWQMLQKSNLIFVVSSNSLF